MAILDVNEADILSRAIDPQTPIASSEAAQALRDIDFAPEDHAAMADLLAKAKAGSLTPVDEQSLRKYELVNDLLGLLRLKASHSANGKSGL